MIECPHWEPGRITLRRGCTACAAEAKHRHHYSESDWRCVTCGERYVSTQDAAQALHWAFLRLIVRSGVLRLLGRAVDALSAILWRGRR